MVWDATSAAFPQHRPQQNQFPSNPPILPAPKPSIPQSALDTPKRPAKRQRTAQIQIPTPLTTPSPGPSSTSSVIDYDALDAARRRSSARVMTLWESLAERYARSLDEDDEIDILTGKIYKDRGVLRAASEKGWEIGSFGGAIEVEPVGVSEGETETATSEGDDEGEGDGDDFGDAENGDKEEVDPFEAWSYDWQYRALPPPKPELSPKDAEDLEAFLAAERAIQEARQKLGNKSDRAEEEDEVVYLGDSLHDQEGALLDGDSGDDEFASFVVDESTVRLAKLEEQEDEDEEDEVEPMSSILGALAIGTDSYDRSMGSPHTSDNKEPATAMGSYVDNKSNPIKSGKAIIIPNTIDSNTPSSADPGSEVGVDDELIVIDSDTDEEIDVKMASPSKPEPLLTRPQRLSASSPATKPFLMPQQATKVPSSTAQTSSPARAAVPKTPLVSRPISTSTSVSKSSRLSRAALSTTVASLQVSIKSGASRLNNPTPALIELPSSKPPSKPIGKAISKRTTSKICGKKKETQATPKHPSSVPLSPTTSAMRSSNISTKDEPTPPTPTTAPSSLASKAISSSTFKAATKPTPALAETFFGLTSLKSLGEFAEKPSHGATKCKGSGSLIPKGVLKDVSIGRIERDTAGDSSTQSGPFPLSTPGKTSLSSVSTPVASPSMHTSTEDLTQHGKKPLIMEVVLTPLRHTSKAKPQTPRTSTLAIPAEVSSIAAETSKSRPWSEPGLGSAIDDNKAKISQAPTNAVVLSTGARPNPKRKRARESGESSKTEESSPKPRTEKQTGSAATPPPHAIDRTSPCCQPTLPLDLGQNQNPRCCSMPFACFQPPPQPQSVHSHACPHTPCSHSHQSHHYPSIHQHQHQHLHTLLPFPLPQHLHALTGTELTEVALRIMYGLGGVLPNGPAEHSHGHGIWPPGTHAPHVLSAPSISQNRTHPGPSMESCPTKSEKPSSSQGQASDSQERVPSSQEHERWREEQGKGKGKMQSESTGVNKPALLSHSELMHETLQPVAEANSLPNLVDGVPRICVNEISHISTATLPNLATSKVSTPKRESSVIDIESDSEDELAEYNAGEGSMRWEPPIKDEDDSDDGVPGLGDSDDDILLLGNPFNESGRRSRRRIRPKKSSDRNRLNSRTSPSKSRKIP